MILQSTIRHTTPCCLVMLNTYWYWVLAKGLYSYINHHAQCTCSSFPGYRRGPLLFTNYVRVGNLVTREQKSGILGVGRIAVRIGVSSCVSLTRSQSHLPPPLRFLPLPCLLVMIVTSRVEDATTFPKAEYVYFIFSAGVPHREYYSLPCVSNFHFC